MEILEYEFTGQGLLRVYENREWIVGIKNWKPVNDLEGIDCVERHNETDELFVLLSGECILLYGNKTVQSSAPGAVQSALTHGAVFPEGSGKLEIRGVRMQHGKVYNIPEGLWHNTVTRPDTKLILIEAANTGSHNSDVLKLTETQIAEMKELVHSIWQNT
jgi:mannose-6-phosphate isomerase-like protein (cupin superfamily)